MTKKNIEFRDPVVERVVDKFISRSDVGFKKYAVKREMGSAYPLKAPLDVNAGLGLTWHEAAH